MKSIYIIRAILDTTDDVVRDVAIYSDSNLFDLHHLLVEAFQLDKGEMSSFFKSNKEWDQGEEISMMDFDPSEKLNALEKVLLDQVMTKTGARMLFAYDFMNLWTFYIELTGIKKADSSKQYPLVMGGVGDRPAEPPQREMKSENWEDEDPYDLGGNEEYGEEDIEGMDDWY